MTSQHLWFKVREDVSIKHTTLTCDILDFELSFHIKHEHKLVLSVSFNSFEQQFVLASHL